MNRFVQQFLSRSLSRIFGLRADLAAGWILLWSAALFCAPCLAQTLPANDARIKAHREALWAERLDRYLSAGRAAEANSPAAGLERNRDQLTRAMRELRALGNLTLAIQGHSEGALFGLAECLDAMAIPGLVEAGRGEPQIVKLRVYAAWSPPAEARPSEPLVLSIGWLAPDGERRPARQERVLAQALMAPGTEFFFRAPSGPPGRWWLTLELSSADGSAHAAAPSVPFDVVSRLAERRLHLAGSAEAQALAWLGELAALEQHGLRPAHGLAAETALAAAEAALSGALPQGWWRPPFAPSALGYCPPQAQGWALLLSEPGRLGAWHWSGALGSSWRAWCEQQGCLLLVVDTPDWPAVLERWGRESARFGPALENAPLVIAPGAAGLLAVQGLLADPARRRWSWVLEGRGPAPPSLALPGVLLLGNRAYQAFLESGGQAGPERLVLPAPESALETELALPELLRAWRAPADPGAAAVGGSTEDPR